MKQISPTVFGLILALFITLGVWLSKHLTVMQRVEYISLDNRVQTRNALIPHEMDNRIVFVGIDDTSLAKMGSWPLPRKLHAYILQLLATQEPRVVTWDVLFTEHKKSAPQEDAYLVETAQLYTSLIMGGNLVTEAGFTEEDIQRRIADSPLPKSMPTFSLTEVVGDDSSLPRSRLASLPFSEMEYPELGITVPSLAENCLIGFVDVNEAADGVYRRIPLVAELRGKVYPSLVLQTLIAYFGLDSKDVLIEPGKAITLRLPSGDAPLVIPIDARGQMLINYRGEINAFAGINYYGLGVLLEKLNSASPENPIDPELLAGLPELKDKIVVFGLVGTGFDTGTTPLRSDNLPKVTIHLNALDNILQRDSLQAVPVWIWLPTYLLLVLVVGAVLGGVRFVWLLPLGLVTIVAYGGVAYALFIYGDTWLPIASQSVGIFLLSVGIMAYRYFGQERAKSYIQGAMAAYIPASVMSRVLEDPEELKLGGVKRDISVMFCDIRGFTKYCDERDPEEVVGALNDYLSVMSDVIMKYEGTLDKYIGDCIMAFWNAPEDQPDHAQRAVCCAMEMRYALSVYKTSRAGLDQEIFECGIGIHSGPALVGNVGSNRRFNYTAIGSTVNMAARLEALTKRFTSRIIVSEYTRNQLIGDFTTTDLGMVTVAGFADQVKLYSVEAYQDIYSALEVGRRLAQQSRYTASDVKEPLWEPAPLPDDAD